MLYIPKVGPYPNKFTLYLAIPEDKVCSMRSLDVALTVETKKSRRKIVSGYAECTGGEAPVSTVPGLKEMGVEISLDKDGNLVRVIMGSLDMETLSLDKVQEILEDQQNKEVSVAFGVLVTTWAWLENNLDGLDDVIEKIRDRVDQLGADGLDEEIDK